MNTSTISKPVRWVAVPTLLGISFLLQSHPLRAQPPSIELHALPLMGGQSGSTVRWNIIDGKDLDELQSISFSHPGIRASSLAWDPTPLADGSEPPDPAWGNLDVSIGSDVPPGVYTARVVGRLGLSNSRRFLVTPKPWHVDPSGTTIESAIGLDDLGIWQDQSVPKTRKFYRIEFHERECKRIATHALSLDSRARLVLSLMDSNRTTVATADATNEQDAALKFVAPESGPYWLVVHDHVFRGGPEFRYAIEVTSDSPAPPSSTELAQQTWREWEQAAESIARAIRPPTVDASPLSTPQFPMSEQSWSPFAISLRVPDPIPTIEIHEESANALDIPKPISLPSIVCGRFDTNDDVDSFEASLEANQEIVFEIVSHRIGQPTDPKLTVYQLPVEGTPNGTPKRIGDADDMPAIGNPDLRIATKDFAWSFKVPEKARYRFCVRDQQRSRRTPESSRYAIHLRAPQPEFRLCTHLAFPVRESDQSRMMAPTLGFHQSIGIHVNAIRLDGFAQPIDLRIAMGPTWLRAAPVTIATEQTSVQLVVHNVGENGMPLLSNSLADLQLIGESIAVEPSLVRRAVPAELVWGKSSVYPVTIPRLTNSFPMAASIDSYPIEMAIGIVENNSSGPIEAKRGETIKIPVRIARSEGAKQRVVVRLRNLPNKVNAPELIIDPNTSEGTIDLAIPKDAPLGMHSTWAQCETTLQFARNPQSVERAKGRLERLRQRASASSTADPSPLTEAIAQEQERLKKLEESAKPRDYPVQVPSSTLQLLIVDPK